MYIFLCLLVAAAIVGLSAQSAWAYVGPGAGLSLLSALWTLLVAILGAVGFLVMWPLRRRLRRATKRDAPVQRQAGELGSDAADATRRDNDPPSR